jgi:hypothetical protein
MNRLLRSRIGQILTIALSALTVAGWSPGAQAVVTVTNVFSTQFERSEGYDPAFELVGQHDWLRYPAAIGANGFITNFVGSQAAYIGLFPPNPKSDSFSVWRPIDYFPPADKQTLVQFSVRMDIEDSFNNQFDSFFWSLYNSWNDLLFTLEFNNDTWAINYLLDGDNNWAYTGHQFTNQVIYTLSVTMDFQANRWSAMLDDRLLLSNQPITTVGSPLNFGDMDAIWSITDPQKPGDNFMIFDDYQVTAEISEPAAAVLSPVGHVGGGQFLLRMMGPVNARYAIDSSPNLVNWTALRTNVLSDGVFDFVDTTAPGMPMRFYRARRVP